MFKTNQEMIPPLQNFMHDYFIGLAKNEDFLSYTTCYNQLNRSKGTERESSKAKHVMHDSQGEEQIEQCCLLHDNQLNKSGSNRERLVCASHCNVMN